MRRICYVFFVCLMGIATLTAQDSSDKPEVDEKYKMFSKKMWRRMDFKIKQNRPFSINGEMPKLLMEALEAGDIKAYKSDSCKVVSSGTELDEMMTIIEVVGVDHDNDPFTPDIMDSVKTTLPYNIFEVMYIKEDVIFDRNRSRMYWYIKSLSITVPSNPDYLESFNISGELDKVLNFKYEEVVEVFKRDKYKDRAIWYNGQNASAHRSIPEAMELRLFYAPIIKVANDQDRDIRQLYGAEIAADPMRALVIQQQLEYDLAEYEAELWSY